MVVRLNLDEYQKDVSISFYESQSKSCSAHRKQPKGIT